MNTATRDQYDAATADALRYATALLGDTARPAPTLLHPWIIGQFTALASAMLAGRTHLCPHIGHSPMVLHTFAWAPGALVCSACVGLLRPDPAEDTTCDRCRKHADPIHPATAQSGPILLGFGLCGRCAHRIGLHQRP